MSEERSRTEWWIDYSPWPGPDEVDPFEAVAEAINELGRAVGEGVEQVITVFVDWSRQFGKAIIAQQASIYALGIQSDYELFTGNPMIEPVLKPAIKDRDRRIPRHRHGPYEGAGFDHRGRRRY